MIQVLDLAAYLQALRKQARENHGILHDTLTLISDACIAEGEEANPIQIAGTMIELAYPGTIGPLVYLTCQRCKIMLVDEDDKKTGFCVDCLLKERP